MNGKWKKKKPNITRKLTVGRVGLKSKKKKKITSTARYTLPSA